MQAQLNLSAQYRISERLAGIKFSWVYACASQAWYLGRACPHDVQRLLRCLYYVYGRLCYTRRHVCYTSGDITLYIVQLLRVLALTDQFRRHASTLLTEAARTLNK